jgi:hypothetical protein
METNVNYEDFKTTIYFRISFYDKIKSISKLKWHSLFYPFENGLLNCFDFFVGPFRLMQRFLIEVDSSLVIKHNSKLNDFQTFSTVKFKWAKFWICIQKPESSCWFMFFMINLLIHICGLMHWFFWSAQQILSERLPPIFNFKNYFDQNNFEICQF